MKRHCQKGILFGETVTFSMTIDCNPLSLLDMPLWMSTVRTFWKYSILAFTGNGLFLKKNVCKKMFFIYRNCPQIYTKIIVYD